MQWIKAIDLEIWARTVESQTVLPLLIRRLIKFSGKDIKSISFPSGSNAWMPGFDGRLEVGEGSMYIPEGKSIWEMGVNSDFRSKANREFNGRTVDADLYKSFVFVTPWRWRNKEDWISEKRQFTIWKDIIVIDGQMLEEWLESCPPVAIWFATNHLRKRPLGVQEPMEYILSWCTGPFQLSHEILLGGRVKESDLLIKSIENKTITAIKAHSKEEALAFTIATALSSEKVRELFIDRAIILENRESFRLLADFAEPLILILQFEDEGLIYNARNRGHCILAPVGIEDSGNWPNVITLRRLDVTDFENGLLKSGLSKDKAEIYAKQSARNVTILRRRLGFNFKTPSWAKTDVVRNIIPALLLNRWDEEYDEEKKALSELAGMPYEEYQRHLTILLNSDDSPLVKIGSTWRIVSPLDAWTYLGKYVTEGDFVKLNIIYVNALSEVNPIFELTPDQRLFSFNEHKRTKYSAWIRTGLAEALCLVSAYESELQFTFRLKEIISKSIRTILSSESLNFWRSIQDVLPLIAETSPQDFLTCLTAKVDAKSEHITELFIEETGTFNSRNYIDGILWSLEAISWMPAYLSDGALLLSKLILFQQPSRSSNSPENSLVEIFRPWFHQTYANLEERVRALRIITRSAGINLWNVLIRLIPTPRAIAHGTYKLKWKFQDTQAKEYTPEEEYNRSINEVVDLIVNMHDLSEMQLIDLLNRSIYLSKSNRDKVFTLINNAIKKSPYMPRLWDATRTILHTNRKFTNQSTLHETDLIQYEELYNKLIPTNRSESIAWLFNKGRPEVPEGFNFTNSKPGDYEKHIAELRQRELTKLIKDVGNNAIWDLAKRLDVHWFLGVTIPFVIENDSEIIEIITASLDSSALVKLGVGVIAQLYSSNGLKFVLDLFDKVAKENKSANVLGRFFLAIPTSRNIWNRLNIEGENIVDVYWNEMQPFGSNLSDEELESVVQQLAKHNRAYTAIQCVYFEKARISTPVILEILNTAAVNENSDTAEIDAYQIEQLFELLDERPDLDKEFMKKLEWAFLPIFTSHSPHRPAKYLNEQLVSDPSFFVEVLTVVYKPEGDENAVPENPSGLTQEQLQNRLRKVNELLSSCRVVPGKTANTIDKHKLQLWIEEVLKGAKMVDRVSMAEYQIGRLLSAGFNYSDYSLPDEICEMIELLNSQNANSGVYIGISNGLGIVGYAPDGSFEKERSDRYKAVADQIKERYPTTAKIMENLSMSYLNDSMFERELAERRSIDY